MYQYVDKNIGNIPIEVNDLVSYAADVSDNWMIKCSVQTILV